MHMWLYGVRAPFASPYEKAHSILGSVLGPLVMEARCVSRDMSVPPGHYSMLLDTCRVLTLAAAQ